MAVRANALSTVLDGVPGLTAPTSCLTEYAGI